MKKIMVTKSVFGSTLVEVLVSMILIGILMLSATRFFIVAWCLDAEQQEYLTILNNIANTLEIGINNRTIYNIASGASVYLNNNKDRSYMDSFRGISVAYKDSVYDVVGVSNSALNIRCNYLVCELEKRDGLLRNFGLGFFVLKTAYYKKWDIEEEYAPGS